MFKSSSTIISICIFTSHLVLSLRKFPRPWRILWQAQENGLLECLFILNWISVSLGFLNISTDKNPKDWVNRFWHCTWIPRVCCHILIRTILVLLWGAHSLSLSKYFIYTLFFLSCKELPRYWRNCIMRSFIICTYLILPIIWMIRQMIVRWTECVMCEREEEWIQEYVE